MSDPLDVLAGEYVLGTLDAAERAAFLALLERDADARAAVAAWERRFAPLVGAVDAVPPDPGTWAGIAARLQPGAARSERDVAPLQALLASRNRWRGAALLASTVAAVAVALAVLAGLRTARHDAILVAAVNRGGEKPALIVRVDPARRRITVRPVAATAPPGRSLELWAVNAPAAPRSLGLVGAALSDLALPAGAGAGTTIAVSVEPEGGSKTGAPTGPVVYAGQLFEE